MPSVYIFYIIICKLSHKQKFCLIVIFQINKSSKIGLYNAVLLLCFVFCLLKIKGNRKMTLDTKKITK